MKRNFPGGNDGGLQAHPLKILTDGRMIKFECPCPVTVAPIIVRKPDLCVKIYVRYKLTY